MKTAVIESRDGTVYEIRRADGYVRVGDIVTVDEHGEVRKAKPGESVVGMVVEDIFPKWCLLVWNEKRL